MKTQKRKTAVLTVLMLAILGSAVPVQAEQYVYDDLNRVKTVTYDDGSFVTYTYDANGNIEDIKTYNKDGKPVNPDKPISPDDPVSPDKPQNPDDPVSPDKPKAPDNPANPEKPTGTGSGQDAGSGEQQETIRVETETAFYRIEKGSGDAGEAVFVAVKNKKSKSYTVPDKISFDKTEYPVTEIADKAFYQCTALKKVTVGKNIEKIGKKAFYGAKNLKKITVKTEKLTAVGKSALKGIHKNAVIKVPKKQLKKYQKLFRGKGQKKTVKIKR